MTNFKVGDFVICNTKDRYIITNTNTLCIVAKANPNKEEIGIFVLITNVKSSIKGHRELTKEAILELTKQDYDQMSCCYFNVMKQYFDKITLEDYCAKVNEKGWEIIYNRNFANIVEILTNKEEEVEMKEVAPILHLNGKYNFSDSQRDYIKEKMSELMTEFDHPNSEVGLSKIWDTVAQNKQGAAFILSKHPNWDDKAMAIVFEEEFKRVQDKQVIRDFCEWIGDQLTNWARPREYKYHCCTMDELERMKRKLNNIISYMNDLRRYNTTGRSYHVVKFDGMTYEEMKREYYRVTELYDYASKHSYYATDGIYLNKENSDKLHAGHNFINLISDYESNVADEEFAQKANEYAAPFDKYIKGKRKGLGAVKGQKVSRIVQKFFKNYGFDKIVDNIEHSFLDQSGHMHNRTVNRGWNYQYTMFADAINPLITKRKVIISINPLDFLTMSFGKGWQSCHTIDKKNKRGGDYDHNYSGCYCGGTLSYMLDKPSIIMYTISEDYNGTDYWTQDKIHRCMFYLGEDKIVQSRLYPDGRTEDCETSMSGQFRTVLQKTICECIGAENKWILCKGTSACEDVTTSEGVHYRDYLHYDDCNVSYLKREGIQRNETIIEIGHNSICPYCGKEHSTADWLSCGRCRRMHPVHRTCCNCGEEIPDGQGVYDVDRQVWYCDGGCANENDCYYCNNVDEWHSSNVYVDDYTGEHFCDPYVDRITFDDEEWNSHCYMTMENANEDGWYYIESRDDWYHRDEHEISRCPHCGEWYLEEDADDGTCPECGVVISTDMIEEAV